MVVLKTTLFDKNCLDVAFMKIVKFKTIILITFCICIVGLLPSSNLAQQSTEEIIRYFKSKLFDASFATYQLQVRENGRGILFCNTSKKRIEHIQLGCVKRKNGELLILSKRDLTKWDSNPETEEIGVCQFWDTNHGFFPVDECKKGKLALIEVAFEDDTTWNLKP